METATAHLDQDALRRLLRGELRGEEARRLADHLEGACPRCDELLASTAGQLDGAVDLALLRLAAGGEPGNDLEWRRIRRRLDGRGLYRRPAAWAAAALVLVAAGAGLWLAADPAPRDPARWDGVKGTAPAPPPVRLRFSVSLPGPAGAAIERGASGAVVPGQASLLFRAETSAPARLALLRMGPDGGEVIWEAEVRGAGALDVEVGGRPAAFPLRGLTGTQRFALLGALDLDRARVEAALRALQGPAGGTPPGPSLSIDLVEVTVR